MKFYLKILLLVWFCISKVDAQNITYPRSEVNFDDYLDLVLEVKEIRKDRLLSLDDFLEFSKDENTVILDTRSKAAYNAIHVKGALNLPFPDFTTQNLRKIIPDANTRILIYCNNNIKGDQINFASKTIEVNAKPKVYVPNSTVRHNSKLLSLALNVPTYINLYGYGYRNIYELDEFVDIKDDRIEFELARKARIATLKSINLKE